MRILILAGLVAWAAGAFLFSAMAVVAARADRHADNLRNTRDDQDPWGDI